MIGRISGAGACVEAGAQPSAQTHVRDLRMIALEEMMSCGREGSAEWMPGMK
jgi:hypothetical protein